MFPALLLRSQLALSDCFLVITLPCHHMKRYMDSIDSYLHPAIRSVHFANADILLVWRPIIGSEGELIMLTCVRSRHRNL
jgi:hypothetical protein